MDWRLYSIIKISANEKIYTLINHYPQIKEIMHDLGFTSILNPVMLNSVGKITSINSGAKMRHIDKKLIKEKFLSNNFILEDLHDE